MGVVDPRTRGYYQAVSRREVTGQYGRHPQRVVEELPVSALPQPVLGTMSVYQRDAIWV